jgi:hypothetical protein
VGYVPEHRMAVGLVVASQPPAPGSGRELAGAPVHRVRLPRDDNHLCRDLGVRLRIAFETAEQAHRSRSIKVLIQHQPGQ